MASFGHLDTAIPRFRHALIEISEARGDTHYYTLKCLSGLASACRDVGEYEQAAELNRRVLRGALDTLGRENRFTIGSLSDLALSLAQIRDFNRAELVIAWPLNFT